MSSAEPVKPVAGRYVVYGAIASGGMATVEYGRRVGPLGFGRPVAIKRPHPHFLKDAAFVAMFVDEARLSSHLHHANIVSTLDLIEDKGQLGLVMEYVHGETLERLLELALQRGEPVPVPIATALITAVLHGLHAAHETCDDQGEPLGIVHRDVSPQNILVGEDGAPRVLDFGIAKGTGRSTATPTGHIKGKLLYMAPEQLHAEPIDRRADIYGASVVLWETLIGRALFDADSESSVMQAVLEQPVKAPSTLRVELPKALDHIVLRALARNASLRYPTAREMALALEREVGIATQSEVSAWVHHLAGDRLAARARELQRMQAAVEQPPPIEHGTIEPSPSEHAVAAPTSQVVARGRGMRWTALAVGLALIALVLWSLGRMTQPSPPPPAAELRSKHEDAVPVPATQPTPIPPVLQPTPPAAPKVQAPVTKSPAPQPRATKPRKVVSTPRISAPVARKPDCTQPYVIDDEGIKHPRPECL